MDSSKDPVRLLYFIQSGYWNPKVIHLIRDGRGDASSYMKHDGISIREAAHEWRLTNKQCQRIHARNGSVDWLTVRHEDLCKDPTGTLKGIFEFIGLDSQQATLCFRSAGHHIRGNNMRLRDASEIRLDESWRSSVSAWQLREFNSVAGEFNRSYGYL